jgi:uncharacterized protein YndB with AHSA1/START domain
LESADNSVRIEVRFNASIENVWKAWTESAAISKWFGSDPDGKVLKAQVDARKGCGFEITFQNSDQEEHSCSGMYLEVTKPSLLRFTWRWKNEPGVESVVTVKFSSEKNLTTMYFEHVNFGAKSKHNYLQGWHSTFKKLEKALHNE